MPASETGLNFTNILSLAQASKNRILYNGSGVAAGDVNGDGWCDLYFCRLEGPNQLYLNRGRLEVRTQLRSGDHCLRRPVLQRGVPGGSRWR
jgi:hypothetical protein